MNNAKTILFLKSYRYSLHAFGKALGTGVRDFELNDVTTLNDKLGAPYIILTGKALEIAGDKNISVSISHTKEYATAIVIIY